MTEASSPHGDIGEDRRPTVRERIGTLRDKVKTAPYGGIAEYNKAMQENSRLEQDAQEGNLTYEQSPRNRVPKHLGKSVVSAVVGGSVAKMLGSGDEAATAVAVGIGFGAAYVGDKLDKKRKRHEPAEDANSTSRWQELAASELHRREDPAAYRRNMAGEYMPTDVGTPEASPPTDAGPAAPAE